MMKRLFVSLSLLASLAPVNALAQAPAAPPPAAPPPPAPPPAAPPPAAAPPPPAAPPAPPPPVAAPPAAPPPAAAPPPPAAQPLPPAIAPVPPPAPASAPIAQLSTLRLLREKGVISQAEYDRALRDIDASAGARGGDDVTFTVSKFAATLYGFVEADTIWDSTQSFSDVAGNTAVAAPTTYAGSHSRVSFGVRNSRFGLRVKAPDTAWFHASGVLELDFEGATLPIGSGQPYFGTEAAFFNTPTPRIRQGYVRFETPIVDILAGQTWNVFGWGGNYVNNSVLITGVVGQILSRTTQFRISHTFASDVASFEIAVAAARPVQRNSGAPDGTAGFQLAFPKWSGMQTVSSTGTRIAPVSLAVAGIVRKVRIPEFSASPKVANSLTAAGVSVDAFLPVIPATRESKGNSLSLTGEFVYGKGISDLYAGLTGGVSNPPLPNPMMTTPAPTYTSDVDPGIAAYDNTGKADLIRWTTFNVGVQYYFPGLDGRLWISGNYFRTKSPNAGNYLGVAANAMPDAVATAQAKVRDHEELIDANIFGDPYPGLRFGLGYAHYADTAVNGVTSINHRVQFSGFFIF